MKKNNSLWLAGMLLPCMLSFSLKGFAQYNLQPGDSVPPIVLQQFLNTKHSPIDLKRTAAKLVVLDFWNTWCGSCIRALPKLDALQAKFTDICIVSVTDQDSKFIRQFLSKKGIVLKHLAMHTNDSMLQKYFPYQSLPHTVWISEGKVVYVTYGYNVNATIIEKFLAGERPALSLKDGSRVYDKHAALWAKGNALFATQPQRYSYLSGWLHEYGSSIEMGFVDSSSLSVGMRMINRPLKTLIVAAFGQEYKNENRVLMEGVASSQLVWNNQFGDEDERRTRNLICYELKVPMAERSNIPRHIRTDLQRYLDFSIQVERRTVLCYVITPTNLLQSHEDCGEQEERSPETTGRFSFCGKFTSLVAIMQEAFTHDPRPIIDKSGYAGNIHVALKGAVNDIGLVKRMLAQNGFEMTEQETEIDMLVLKDRVDAECK